ncbi:MAG: 3'-5' exonuclease domain-containing protein 2 [Bacteroidales bacterium]|nr:3'-5' exonuclease domain-containing protein 2 [Bacteroidales bacterium]
MNYYNKIPKEILNELPVRSFEGEIYLIDNNKSMHKAIIDLKKQAILGFDTETRPAFKKGVFHKVSLLQLATNNRAYLFRLHETGLPPELSEILSNTNIIKTGVAIKDDIKALQKLNKFSPGAFIELQKYVDGFGIEDNGLKKITGNVLGFRISKGARLTNWDNNTLTDTQLRYAATDAWVSYEIYKKLSGLNGTDLNIQFNL